MNETGLTTGDDAYLSALLEDSPTAPPHELPRLIAHHAGLIGADGAVVYLVDLQQRVLAPFGTGPPLAGPDEHLGVDSTIAGRAYQSMQPVERPLPGGEGELWVPLLDGADRLGVLRLTFSPGEWAADRRSLVVRAGRYATLVAEFLVSKSMYGDAIIWGRRHQPSTLPAEVQWSLLPPLNFQSPTVTIAGSLEPAYDVAGDSLDYAVNPGRVHVAVLDAMGHGLESARVSVLVVSAYRHARRRGDSLTEMAQYIDHAVAQMRAGEAFATGVLAELDPDAGALRWVNAGHPDPLLLRDGRLVKTLETTHWLPLGLNAVVGRPALSLPVGHEPLQRGDRVLFYTDGVVEARSEDGEFFGRDRLVDLVTRNLSQLTAPESMRRVVRAVFDHQHGRLDDDASMLLLEWLGPGPDKRAPVVPHVNRSG